MSWCVGTCSTLLALLGNLEQRSRCKPLGSWLKWESEPVGLHPFLYGKHRLFEIKSSLTKTGLNYRSEILSRTANRARFPRHALWRCFSNVWWKRGPGGWVGGRAGCATCEAQTCQVLCSVPSLLDTPLGSCWVPSSASESRLLTSLEEVFSPWDGFSWHLAVAAHGYFPGSGSSFGDPQLFCAATSWIY